MFKFSDGDTVTFSAEIRKIMGMNRFKGIVKSHRLQDGKQWFTVEFTKAFGRKETVEAEADELESTNEY